MTEEKKELSDVEEARLKEKERKEAMAARVEEARKKFAAEREAMKKKAPRITAELLQGIDYSEDFAVKLFNNKWGVLTLRPLAEGEMVILFTEVEELARERLENLSTEKNFDPEDFKFFWSVVSASTGLPIDLIKKTFAMGESAEVATRILEMSGFVGDVEEEVESFLE